MLWILCDVKLQQRDLSAARAAFLALSKTNYPKDRMNFMQAKILFFDGKWREAAEQFERLRPLLAHRPSITKQNDLYAAQCYGMLGEYDKQLEACHRVLQSDPTSMTAQVGVAQANLAMGKTGEAKKAYEGLARALGKDKAMSIPQSLAADRSTADGRADAFAERQDASGAASMRLSGSSTRT